MRLPSTTWTPRGLPSRFWIALAIAFVLGGHGLAPAMAQGAPGGNYRIGPRDQIQVRVRELPDLDSEQVVAEDGSISLGVVGRLQAAGLTEAELEDEIGERLLQEGLRKASVAVTIAAYRSRPVSVMGAVREPGNHFVPGRATLMEVLLNAGGLDSEHGPVIYVRRRAENGLTDQVAIDVRQLVGQGDPQLNIPIFAGDLINVPAKQPITINVLGEVSNVGSLVFPGDRKVTLLMAIASAGGLSETASKKLSIQRGTTSGNREEIVADYRRILAGKDPDIELQDGDLIVVKESFF
ncbi:MAG: polysaccharide biosynthesis/export family protein [Acidobacteriota bacterium]